MKKLTTQNKQSLTSNLIGYARIFSCVAFLFATASANAKDNSNLLQEYSSDLAQIETYLNGIKNLSAKFTQESSEGTLVSGKFLLSRPGKMRIEYSTQPKIVITVNGAVLSYYDVELDEVSRISTNTTPASFLTRQNISFSAKDVELTGVKKSSNQIKVSVMKKNRKEAGEFSLIFSTNPLRFIKMEVKNDLDQTVVVTLSDVDFTSVISDHMFVLKK